jgi:hypothetical protein
MTISKNTAKIIPLGRKAALLGELDSLLPQFYQVTSLVVKGALLGQLEPLQTQSQRGFFISNTFINPLFTQI